MLTNDSNDLHFRIKNYLKALQQHLSSQFARQLSRGPGYSHWTFCSLAKRSRFRSKGVHEEEAELHQTLSHMIPTEHTVDQKSRSNIGKQLNGNIGVTEQINDKKKK